MAFTEHLVKGRGDWPDCHCSNCVAKCGVDDGGQRWLLRLLVPLLLLRRSLKDFRYDEIRYKRGRASEEAESDCASAVKTHALIPRVVDGELLQISGHKSCSELGWTLTITISAC